MSPPPGRTYSIGEYPTEEKQEYGGYLYENYRQKYGADTRGPYPGIDMTLKI